MTDDLKSKLMRVVDVDEGLADKIVKSGVSMRGLFSADNIALAYNLSSILAGRIKFAAGRFSRAASEGTPAGDLLDKLRRSRVSQEALVAIGLPSESAQSIVLFEGEWWSLAVEAPGNLYKTLGVEPINCVRAIALARLITFYEGEAKDLLAYKSIQH